MEPEEIVASKPINKTAALVMSKGFDYSPDKKIGNFETDIPVPTRPIDKQMRNCVGFVDLTGHRFGRFQVIGLAKNILQMWVVRCQCGRYSTRRKKAITNPNNSADCCNYCRHLVFLKRNDYWRQTGIDKHESFFL